MNDLDCCSVVYAAYSYSAYTTRLSTSYASQYPVLRWLRVLLTIDYYGVHGYEASMVGAVWHTTMVCMFSYITRSVRVLSSTANAVGQQQRTLGYRLHIN
jgi:hypothetical protein